MEVLVQVYAGRLTGPAPTRNPQLNKWRHRCHLIPQSPSMPRRRDHAFRRERNPSIRTESLMTPSSESSEKDPQVQDQKKKGSPELTHRAEHADVALGLSASTEQPMEGPRGRRALMVKMSTGCRKPRLEVRGSRRFRRGGKLDAGAGRQMTSAPISR